MAKCLKETAIHSIRISDPEKEMRKYKATGDLEIRNQLVMHYISGVHTAIYEMRNLMLSNIPFDDFFDQGVLALIDCIERYDPDRGASFETFSYTAIRGAILKYLRKQNWLPNRLWEARKNITKGRSELCFQLMREPTLAELAEHLGISESRLSKEMVEISVIDTVSFEEMLESSYYTQLETKEYSASAEGSMEAALFKQELHDTLGQVIEQLPARQKQVIALYYYENLTLLEIGQVLELSPQRIAQIKKSALEQMKKVMQQKGY